MEALLLAVMAASNILCFVLGARLGQKETKCEEIKLRSVNPLQVARDHKARKEAEMEQDKFEKILLNIEKYDGTTKGQEDVP